MSWNRQQLITQAYSKLGINGDFDISPEMFQSAARDLDCMLAEWNAMGIRIGWPFPSDPDGGDLLMDLALPDAALSAIYLKLAIRIAPDFGKAPSPHLIGDANRAFTALMGKRVAAPVERQYPGTMPLGAGNQRWVGQTFVTPPVFPMQADGDVDNDFD